MPNNPCQQANTETKRKKKMKVTIIRGLPGSGKSTKAREVACGCLHLEADMYFMHDGKYVWEGGGKNHDWCQAAFKNALAQGMDVVVSNTFTRLKEMSPYLEISKLHGADVRVIAMKGNYGNVHNVPAETMKAMQEHWEDFPGEEVFGEDAQSVHRPCSADATEEGDKPKSDDPLIQSIIDSPLVKVRDLGDGIYSCNFKKKSFYKGCWDEATTKARGLFIRGGQVFARSFDKFFRVNENPSSSVDVIMG